MIVQNSTKMTNFPSFLFFQTGSVAPNKSPETPEIFKSLKVLNFMCRALKDSTLICQIYDFKALNLEQCRNKLISFS